MTSASPATSCATPPAAAPALEIGEVPFTTPITRARITRLVSDTDYVFFVEARDAAGNVSAPSHRRRR